MKRTITLENGKEVAISEESYQELARAVQEEIIPVPDSIHLICDCESGWENSILFNNNKQRLCSCHGNYNVVSKFSGYTPTRGLKLVPCKREELKEGDIAFMADNKDTDFSRLKMYCIILDDKSYVRVSELDVMFYRSINWNYWWKVVKQ